MPDFKCQRVRLTLMILSAKTEHLGLKIGLKLRLSILVQPIWVWFITHEILYLLQSNFTVDSKLQIRAQWMTNVTCIHCTCTSTPFIFETTSCCWVETKVLSIWSCFTSSTVVRRMTGRTCTSTRIDTCWRVIWVPDEFKYTVWIVLYDRNDHQPSIKLQIFWLTPRTRIP